MSAANELIKVLTAESKGSARSKQEAVGPSEVGGCRRKVWLKLQGQEKVNQNTLRLASVMGTAIHSHIEEAFRKQDPFGERYLLEIEVEAAGIMGHVDMYDIEKMEIIDWKTTKKSNLTYFPSKQQRWQVQMYGWLLEKNNKPVKNVTLVAIARDGDERDIVYHTEPYDEAIALEALKWLREVEQMTEAPAPEKDVMFCKNYCAYYDPTGAKGCASRPKAEAEGELITDHQISLAAQHYLEINEQIADLTKEKDGIKSILEGVSGVTESGIKISWSTVKGRKSIDEIKVKELLGEVPLKYGEETYRLTVKGNEDGLG